MANFSAREGNYTGEMNQTSTSAWSEGALAFLSAINIFLSITASLGNALILVALHKESSLHPPTKLLFRCLAVTDLCVGLFIQPLLVSLIFAIFDKETIMSDLVYNLNDWTNFSSIILCGMSIFTSTAISVERLLALLLGLRYRHVVTLRRTRVVIGCIFLINASGGAIYFWRHSISWILNSVFAALSLITSIFSYTKIYFTLRQHQAQVRENVHQEQPNGGGIPLNVARYKKTVYSIAWVQFALLACYVPFIVIYILMHTMTFSATLSMIALAAITLVYLNSSLNPILYCWKIKEVRQAAMDTIRQCCCLCS